MDLVAKTSDKKFNYNGLRVKIAAEVHPPWFFGEKLDDSDVFEPNDGTSYQFLKFLAEYFNFTWQLIDQKGEWSMGSGGLQTTNKGIISSLLTNEIEWAMGSIPIRLRDYNSSIEFTNVVQVSRITYMTLASEPIEIIGTIFMPFDLYIWIGIVIFLLVLIIITIIFQKVTKIKMDLKWLLITSILLRGARHQPIVYNGMNFLIQLCWFFGWILIAAYGCAIISSLTNDSRVQNIESLNQLIELILNGKAAPIVSGMTTYPMMFKRYRDNNEVYDVLYENLVIAENYHQAIHKMIQTRIDHQTNLKDHIIYSLIAPYKFLDLWASSLGKDSFYLKDSMETSILTDFYGLMFRANSTMLPHFNRCINFARQFGFFHKWYQHTYKWQNQLDGIDLMLKELYYAEEMGFINQPKNLSLANVKDLFLAYLICVLIAIVTVCFENIYKIRFGRNH